MGADQDGWLVQNFLHLNSVFMHFFAVLEILDENNHMGWN